MNRDRQLAFVRELGVPRDCALAMERAELSAIDALTTRDLLALSPCADGRLAALLVCMFLSLRDGSLCLRLEAAALESRLRQFRPAEQDVAGEAAAILESVNRETYSELISTDARSFTPLIRLRTDQGEFLYFQKHLAQALSLRASLVRLTAAGRTHVEAPMLKELNAVKEALDDTLDRRPVRAPDGAPIILNVGQATAICLALLRDLTIVSGGPGTGKTSIIVSLLRCLARLGFGANEMRVAAPTGLAAQRIQESIRSSLSSIERPVGADGRVGEVECGTIHRLLRFSPRRNAFAHNARNPLPVRALIVDEVSMVDVGLMASLLSAVADGTKVVLLGDRHQLPSVEAGAVLADLAPDVDKVSFSESMREALRRLRGIIVAPDGTQMSKAGEVDASQATLPDRRATLTDRLVFLKGSFRSAAGILRIAEAVNAGHTTIVDEMRERELTVTWQRRNGAPDGARIECASTDGTRSGASAEGGVLLVPESCLDTARLNAIIESWARWRFLPATGPIHEIWHTPASAPLGGGFDVNRHRAQLDSLFQTVGAARILTLTREGPCGCVTINRSIAAALRHELDPGGRDSVFAGEPIIVTRNDYARQLFNGEIGVIVRGGDGACCAVFPKQGAYAVHPVSALPPFEPAFAVTVHKSQGSEYGQVFLVLPDDPAAPLLTREILYTALTRAKHSVIVAGSAAVLRRAIERKIERESGMNLLSGE